jgi:hypothetical protein
MCKKIYFIWRLVNIEEINYDSAMSMHECILEVSEIGTSKDTGNLEQNMKIIADNIVFFGMVTVG